MQKIVIGTPWNSAFMHTPWVDAALKLRPPSGYCLEWVRGLGWCDARRVNYIIEHALKVEADLIAFIEGDVIVPPEWLEAMTKHIDTGKRVISSIVPMRGRANEAFTPFEPMAWNIIDNKVTGIDQDNGLQPVDFVSLCAVMMDANIFRENDKVWTWHTFDKKKGYKAVGGTADTYMMQTIRRCGITIWADPAIKAKHLHAFEIDDTFGARFPEWEATKGR